MHKEKIKILLADDHQLFREGVNLIIKREEDFDLVGECVNGDEALKFLEKNEVSVFMTDIKMPGMDGVELAGIIKKNFPAVKTLVLSSFNDEKQVIDAIKAGVSGYILKNCTREELVNSIRAIAAGNSYYCSEVSEVLHKHFITKVKKPKKQESEIYHKVSQRELEVLKLISEENTNHEIATKLFISTHTVITHRRNLLQKFNVKNTAGLIKYAIQNHLI